MNDVLVVCAVSRELDAIDLPSGAKLLASGIGPVEAASAVAAEVARAPYQLVINAGIAGAFDGRAKIGDAVVVARDHYAELGTEDEEATLRDGSTLIGHADSDRTLVEALAERGFALGSGVTVARVTAVRETAARLAQKYDATVESMEGFAVLRAAQRHGVRAIEVRGISNMVGPRAEGGFDFRAGTMALQQVLPAVLECWKQQR